VEQQFSVTKISIDYGRPAVKGRKILENWCLSVKFGELVLMKLLELPLGKM
jgi:hypothetical protein